MFTKLRLVNFKSWYELQMQKDTALYFCNNTGSQSHITRMELDLLGNIQNWPEDFFGEPLQEQIAMQRAQLSQQKRHAS